MYVVSVRFDSKLLDHVERSIFIDIKKKHRNYRRTIFEVGFYRNCDEFRTRHIRRESDQSAV